LRRNNSADSWVSAANHTLRELGEEPWSTTGEAAEHRGEAHRHLEHDASLDPMRLKRSMRRPRGSRAATGWPRAPSASSVLVVASDILK